MAFDNKFDTVRHKLGRSSNADVINRLLDMKLSTEPIHVQTKKGTHSESLTESDILSHLNWTEANAYHNIKNL